MSAARIAADLAAATAGFNARVAVFSGTTVRGQLHSKDVEIRDEYGGTVLRRMVVFHVPVASYASVAVGTLGTVDGTSYRVHDVRLIAGGAMRELVLARVA